MKILITLFVISLSVYSQDGWFYLSPKPTNQSFQQIQFVSQNIGYASSGSLLFKTNDGGNSWKSKRIVNRSYANVTFRFISQTTGWVFYTLGDTLTVSKTTNGGSSWTVQTVTPGGKNINSAFFISNLTGYACGSYGKIIKTTDGGSSWNVLNTGYTNHFSTIKFTSNTTGFAFGDSGLIIKTTDAGTTWRGVFGEYQARIVDASFYMQNVGLAVTDKSFIYKTTNGGESWQKIQLGYNMFSLNCVTTVGPTTWLAGSTYSIYRSTNSGETWSEVYDKGTYQSLSFLSPSSVWAAGSFGALAKSTDGGLNWTNLRQGLNGQLNDIKFVDANVGFSIESYGKIFKSTDGGLNWELYATDNDYNLLSKIYFVNTQKGFVMGGNSVSYNPDLPILYRTTNKGVNWQKVELPGITNTHINSMHFPTSNVGYAVGTNKGLLKTTDGGNTWNKITTNLLNQYDFQQVFFTSETNGIIASNYGDILKTQDGGNTWVDLNATVYGSEIRDMHFTDANTGYLISQYTTSSSRYFYKTTDGGLNWNLQYVPGENYDNFRKMSFVNSNLFYVVTFFGSVLKTTNAGSSWEVLDTPAESGLISIDFINNNLGWVAGMGGIVCKYDKAAFVQDTITLSLWVGNKTQLTLVEPGKKILEGEEYIFQPYTLPSAFKKYQTVYNSLVGSHFYIENGSIVKNIKINFAITVPGADSLYGLIGGKKVWFYGDVEVDGYPLGFSFLNKKGAVLKVPETQAFLYLTNALGWPIGKQWTFGYYDTDTKRWTGIGIDTYNQKYEDPNVFDTCLARITHFSSIGAGDEELITSVENESSNIIPKEFGLFQNYPNPFNPVTRIKYELPRGVKVNLTIYNLLGQRVKTLVDEYQETGVHYIDFKAEGLSSGIYITMLKAGEKQLSNKMLLIK